MKIADQIAKIRKQQPIDALPKADCMRVLAHAVYLFRKFVSPVSEAASLEKNFKKIALLCRLENDPEAEAMLLAARAVANLDSSLQPGAWDDFARAAGVDITPASSTTFGSFSGERSVNLGEGTDNAPEGAFKLTYRDIDILVIGGSKDGSETAHDFEQACAIIDQLSVRSTGGQRNLEVKYEEAVRDEEVEIFDTVHDPWRPTKVFSEQLRCHPTEIIEPSTLVATPFPEPSYQPMLPKMAIERGFISDAQFECITYALQAVTQYLPGSPDGNKHQKVKGGFIIGDGTGVGKTNEFAGVIMDQWLRGVRRHIVVVERSSHVDHVYDAWTMIGGDKKDVMFQGDRSAREELPSRDGIMVTTYALLRDDDRYAALLEWANEHQPCNGIVVFDEAHNMRNAVEDKHDEGAGKRNQSQQGQRGVELQDAIPHAGVIYASATMATDVYNLGYANRLGLWGIGAPFVSAQHFIDEMYYLDDAALEQVCIDLKASGRYISRTLSFDGVEFDELEHVLTPRQRERFDLTVSSFRRYQNMLNAAKAVCLGKDPEAQKEAKSGLDGKDNIVFNAQRDTIEHLLTLYNADTMIADIHAELAAGNSPVIQVSATGEARLKRLLGDRTYLQPEEYSDNRLTETIMESMPIHRMYETRNTNGTRIYEKVLDDNGDPIVMPEAVAIRDDALRMAEKIATGMNIFDRLMLEFGPENIAEKTGRSVRLVPDLHKGELKGWKVQERNAASAASDVEDFQAGRKPILIFSLAAGGTGLSYHAARDVKNQRRRTHYLLELGRRAEGAVQGIGRTHRSGQVIPPVLKMMTCDVPAHTIYASKTLAKIAKMGALSRGHSHATSNAIFEQRIPLHTNYASKAWKKVTEDIRAGKIDDMDIQGFKQDMQLEQIDNFDLALRRLAVLTTGQQKQIMDHLRRRTEEEVTAAMRAGTYNQGLETIKADSIEMIGESMITNENGSITTYYRLRRQDKVDRTPFSAAAVLHARMKSRPGARAVFMRHKVNNRIALGITSTPHASSVDMTTPGGTSIRALWAVRSEPWKPITDLEEAERYWNNELENLSLDEFTEMHMLSGSLLYNWNKLPENGASLNRCKTDEGKVIVGRIIGRHDIRKVLQDLGMSSSYTPPQIAMMLSKVEKGASIMIDNGWSIDKPDGSSAFRLNVPEADQNGLAVRELTQTGVVAINSPLGTDYEIPKEEAVAITLRLAVGSDLSLSGVVSDGGALPLAA